MAKYHVNGKGEPGVCRARKNCPFGTPEEHYDSAEEAREAYEEVRSAVPEMISKVHTSDLVGGLTHPPIESAADLATFDPSTMTAFSKPHPRSDPKHAFRSMESLRARIRRAGATAPAEVTARLEAQTREVEYICGQDEAYAQQLEARHRPLAKYLRKRAQTRAEQPPADLDEPEVDGIEDDATSPPEEYRGMSIGEVHATLDEREQEERLSREHEDYLRRNRFNF